MGYLVLTDIYAFVTFKGIEVQLALKTIANGRCEWISIEQGLLSAGYGWEITLAGVWVCVMQSADLFEYF